MTDPREILNPIAYVGSEIGIPSEIRTYELYDKNIIVIAIDPQNAEKEIKIYVNKCNSTSLFKKNPTLQKQN